MVDDVLIYFSVALGTSEHMWMTQSLMVASNKALLSLGAFLGCDERMSCQRNYHRVVSQAFVPRLVQAMEHKILYTIVMR